MDNKSLSHTKWKCLYHIVFIPKYRKKKLYGQVKEDVREIISRLCKYKDVEIIVGAVCVDHVHLSVAIPPQMSVSSFMGYLKGKSTLMIYDRHPELQSKWNKAFWESNKKALFRANNKPPVELVVPDFEKEEICVILMYLKNINKGLETAIDFYVKRERQKVEKIFIWGTGHIARKILEQIDVFANYEVLGFVDNSKEKQGTMFYGRKIYSPEMIKCIDFDKIIVLTCYFEEIEMQIQTLFDGKKICVEDRDYFDKKRIIEYYHDSKDSEILEVMEYIKTHSLQVFNYEFVDKYLNMDVELCFDTSCEMYYAPYNGKKMYFSKNFDTYEKAATYYRSILLEQDVKSPHKYLSSEFNVQEGDVVIDVGVAEGNFSLDIVDKVKKIYMIETDAGWIEALQKTFQDYKDKIVIINKFATFFKEGKYVTLDSVIDDSVNFIKMDIEGNEWNALQGAERLIKQSKDLKCAICSYHREYDEILIKDILSKYGMKCSTTKGYMWFAGISNDPMNTRIKLCKAIVRGEKE